MLLLTEEVTIADLIVALEEEEVKELSNLFDPCGNIIDSTKIQYAIDRATEELNAGFVVSGNCGKALLKLGAKNIIIAIARYLLDTIKARPHVVDDARDARARIKEYSLFDTEFNCPLSDEDLAEILGEPAPVVDRNFRFSSSGRCWIPDDFKDYNDRLFDRRQRGATRRLGSRKHWSDQELGGDGPA